MSLSKVFSGKVVLITGASSGIGAATAQHFAKLGANLALTGRNSENLKQVGGKCTKLGNNTPLLITADLVKETDVEKILDATMEHFKKLDVLVNNAGIYIRGNFNRSTMEHFDKTFAVNVRAVYQLTKLAVPHLEATKGNIVNVSSTAGQNAFSNGPIYSMSKSALNHFTRCLALELAPKRIRVNTVSPGAILTEIIQKVFTELSDEQVKEFIDKLAQVYPLGRVGQPEEVAELISFLASEKADFITGTNVAISGGIHIAGPNLKI